MASTATHRRFGVAFLTASGRPQARAALAGGDPDTAAALLARLPAAGQLARPLLPQLAALLVSHGP
jgi:hypothetical protein